MSQQQTKKEPVLKADIKKNVESSVIHALVAEYFPDVTAQAMAVFTCESGLNPNSIGDGHLKYWQGGVQYGASYGIAQIRHLPGRPSPEWLLDPVNNMTYARRLFESQGWKPWSCKKVLAKK